MHVQDRHAGIHYVHAVQSADIGDGSAAAHIDLAKLSGLERHVRVIHDLADPGEIFRVGIVAAGLSSGSGVLIVDDPVSEISGVALLIGACIERVIGCRYVRGQHPGRCQGPAKRQLRELSAALQKLRHRILEETALSAGRSDGTDLFLVGQQAAGSIFRILHTQESIQRAESAYTVIMSVRADHAAVQAQIPCGACRYDLKLCGEEVILFDIVLLLQDRKDLLLDRVLLIGFLRLLVEYHRL